MEAMYSQLAEPSWTINVSRPWSSKKDFVSTMAFKFFDNWVRPAKAAILLQFPASGPRTAFVVDVVAAADRRKVAVLIY